MREQRQIEKCAAALSKMIDRFGTGFYHKASALIGFDAAEDYLEDGGGR